MKHREGFVALEAFPVTLRRLCGLLPFFLNRGLHTRDRDTQREKLHPRCGNMFVHIDVHAVLHCIGEINIFVVVADAIIVSCGFVPAAPAAYGG
jgi:hypothetical protein